MDKCFSKFFALCFKRVDSDGHGMGCFTCFYEFISFLRREEIKENMQKADVVRVKSTQVRFKLGQVRHSRHLWISKIAEILESGKHLLDSIGQDFRI